MRAFRKSFLWNLMNLAEKTNFIKDFVNILIKYNDFIKKQTLLWRRLPSIIMSIKK